jgi:opacity protein-like surface antigen
LIAAAALAAALLASEACAEDTVEPLFSLSGFGTLGVVHSSAEQADFTNSIFKPNGAGYSESWSAGVDSRLGAQVTSSPTSRLLLVLQVIAEQSYDGTYRPHVEWANIKYQFTPDFSVRVGRTELTAFLVTDTIKVGYTYPYGSRSAAADHRVMALTAAMLTRRKAEARATEEHLDSPRSQAVTGASRISAS